MDLPEINKPVVINYVSKHGERGKAIAYHNGTSWLISTPWCSCECYEHIATITSWSEIRL